MVCCKYALLLVLPYTEFIWRQKNINDSVDILTHAHTIHFAYNKYQPGHDETFFLTDRYIICQWASMNYVYVAGLAKR